jgi:hypothetical protein
VIRDYEKRDEETLKAIHEESEFDYRFPNLDDPLFVYKGVVEERGKVVQGIALKLEATVYIYVSHAWSTPEGRWQRFQELTDEAKRAAWEMGLDTLTCVVPPEIVESFEKRLIQIGMTRDREWPKFSFDLTSYAPKIRVESEIQESENHYQPSLQP